MIRCGVQTSARRTEAQVETALNILSLALFGVGAVAYARQRRIVLAGAGALFFPVTALATLYTWWPLSPAVGCGILLVALALPLVGLLLFAIDVVWAPFCVEMTYLSFLGWLLCPVAVAANWGGVALRFIPA